MVLPFALATIGCDREPKLRSPPAVKGGFTLQCVGITDNARRVATCHFGDGGIRDTPLAACGCDESLTEEGVPEIRPPYNAATPPAFPDPSCTTTLIDACLPIIIPTDLNFKDPNVALPDGQLNAAVALVQQRFDIIHVSGLDTFPGDGNSDELKFRAATDLNSTTYQTCFIAHFAAITDRVFGFAPFTPEWVDKIQELQVQFGDYTTVIDSNSIRFWDASGANLPGGNENWYGSKVLDPPFSFCHEDLTYPFDFRAVIVCPDGAVCSPGIANPPPAERVGSMQCPGGDCQLAPRRFQFSADPSRSNALVTLSGDGETDEAAVTPGGTFEVETKDCTRNDMGAVRCSATLSSATLLLEDFELFDEDVRLVRVEGHAQGGVTGDTLAFQGFVGRAEVRMADQRYDYVSLETGLILAHWEPEEDNVVAAFVFEGDVGDGISARIQGTLGGRFGNVSPVAVAKAAGEPMSGTSQSEIAEIECASPDGTDVFFDGTDSFDDDGDSLKSRWYEASASIGAIPLSTDATFQLLLLPLGDHPVKLLVYDRLGQVGESAITARIVDTMPPVVDVVAPVCVWPPTGDLVHLRLGDELVVSAVDQCAGQITGRTRVTSVASNDSSSNPGEDFFATDKGACIRTTRNPKDSGTTIYTIELETSDTNGNSITTNVDVRVPHDRRGDASCAVTKELEPCL